MLHNEFLKNTSSNSNLPAKSGTQNITIAVYVLQFLSLFTGGLFSLIPLFITYIFRYQARGTWLDSHFRWQIQTFWFSSVFYIAAWIFGFIPLFGWIISVPCFIIATALIIVRTLKGWKSLSKQVPPPGLAE